MTGFLSIFVPFIIKKDRNGNNLFLIIISATENLYGSDGKSVRVA